MKAPVSIDDAFRDALRKGLGRAHAMLQEQDTAQLVDALVQACLEIWTYDAQVEGSRAPYLFELVHLVKDRTAIADRIRDSLAEEASDSDLGQRFGLARLFAREGEQGFAESMRQAFTAFIDRRIDGTWRHWDLAMADEIIALDPVGGTVFVAQELGRMTVHDPEFWDDGWRLAQARELSAVPADVDAALDTARAADPLVEAYLGRIEQTVAKRAVTATRAGPSQVVPGLTWPEARAAIEKQVRGTSQYGFFWWQWGRDARDVDVVAAAQALLELPTGDVELQRPYLCIFKNRAFPLDPNPLIVLIDSSDPKVAWFAVNALENIVAPAVRDKALRMAVEGPLRERALDLLARNWQPGDENIAARLLQETDDLEASHTVGRGLRDVTDRQSSSALVPAMLLAYERTPCSLCRGHFVKSLLQLDALPQVLRDECQWDCSEETRKLARSS